MSEAVLLLWIHCIMTSKRGLGFRVLGFGFRVLGVRFRANTSQTPELELNKRIQKHEGSCASLNPKLRPDSEELPFSQNSSISLNLPHPESFILALLLQGPRLDPKPLNP